MNEERWKAVGAGTGGIGLALGAAALLVAAFRIGWENAAPLFIVFVQLMIALVTLIAFIVIAVWVFAYVTSTLDGFIEEHSEGAKFVSNRTPTLGALTVLGADTLMIVADKSFGRDAAMTIVVSIFLLLGFWVANELTIRVNRLLGLTVWYVIAMILPLFYLQNRQWDFNEVIASFFGLATSIQVLLVMGVIIFIFLPFIPLRESAA